MSRSKRTRPPRFNFYSESVVNDSKDRLLSHQYAALQELQKWFRNENPPIALVSMPTGSGKTGVICCLPYFLGDTGVQFDKPVLVIAPGLEIAKQLEEQILVSVDRPFENFLIRRGIVHRDDQAHVIPSGVKIEKTSAVANEQYLKGKEVVIANAQKFLKGSWEENLPDDLFRLVIVDEAHHFPAPTWLKIIDKFKDHALVVFFTATPFRSDHQTVVPPPFAYHLRLKEARENRIIRGTSFVELPAEAKHDQDLEDPDTDNDEIFLAILEKVKETQERKNEEQPLPGNVPHMAIAITKNTSDAEKVVELWNTRFGNGSAIGFHSRVRPQRRLQKMMNSIKSNQVKVVVVVDMLQEGWDHPPISIAAVMTRIVSPVKFVQFIGRAQRIVRGTEGPESPGISADVITHEKFHQRQNYDKFLNEDLIDTEMAMPSSE